MKHPPLVSIIIPIYNVSLYIERCLKSAFNQTYLHIEYILVDDATPDDSLTKVQNLLNNSPRKENVKIYHHENNRGLSAARNTGIQKATGEYIYFMDSDDELSIDCIEELIVLTTKENPDFVIGEMKIINHERKKYPPLLLKNACILRNEEIINTFLYRKWYEMACSKLVNRQFFIDNELWFYEGIFHEDVLWSFMLALKAKTMIVCKKETYHYYIHSQSISQAKSKRNVEDMIVVLERILHLVQPEQINIQLFGNYLNNMRIYLLKKLFVLKLPITYKKETKEQLNKIFRNDVLFSWKMPIKQRIKYTLLNYFT